MQICYKPYCWLELPDEVYEKAIDTYEWDEISKLVLAALGNAIDTLQIDQIGIFDEDWQELVTLDIDDDSPSSPEPEHGKT